MASVDILPPGARTDPDGAQKLVLGEQLLNFGHEFDTHGARQTG